MSIGLLQSIITVLTLYESRNIHTYDILMWFAREFIIPPTTYVCNTMYLFYSGSACQDLIILMWYYKYKTRNESYFHPLVFVLYYVMKYRKYYFDFSMFYNHIAWFCIAGNIPIPLALRMLLSFMLRVLFVPIYLCIFNLRIIWRK